MEITWVTAVLTVMTATGLVLSWAVFLMDLFIHKVKNVNEQILLLLFFCIAIGATFVFVQWAYILAH